MASNSNRRSSSSVSSNRPGAHARPSGTRGAGHGAKGPSPRDAKVKTRKQPDAPASDEVSVKGGGRGSRKGLIRGILIIAVVLIIAGGAAWGVLGHTDTFKITSIEVKNTSRLSDSYLTTLVDIPEGTNLMNIDVGAVKERLAADPWIEKASVHRSFPHTLVLDITESMPTAVVQVDPVAAIGATEYWFISKDGIWMSQVSSTGVEQAREVVKSSTGSEDLSAAVDEDPVVADPMIDTDGDGIPDASAENVDEDGDGYDDVTGKLIGTTTVIEDDDRDDAADEDEKDGDDPKARAEGELSVCADAFVTVEELAVVPVISGVSIGVQPETGKTETDEGVLNALGILDGSDEEFRDMIASITSATGDSTDIMLKNGIEVAFGPATDIQSKIRIIEQLIADHPDSISYINVRVVSHPSWRGW